MAETVPLTVLLEHLKWNLQRMEEDQNKERSTYYRDAALQRFEFTFKSALKCIQQAAGLPVEENSPPTAVLELALGKGWLPPDSDCIGIASSFTNMSPEHRREHAESIYAELPDHYRKFKFLYDNLCRLAASGSN